MSRHDANPHKVEVWLARSQALEVAMLEALHAPAYRPFDDSPRINASVAAASLALEHGQAVRALIEEDLLTSAVSLMRMQYEALTRSVWLLYAASDLAIAKLNAPLSQEAEAAASKLPMLAEMLKAIDGKAPAAAIQGLVAFKDNNAAALNSFVHGGIHALQRHAQGYPVQLVVQALRNCNGLLTMTAMMLAVLSGNQAAAKRVAMSQADFADCLPSTLAQDSSNPTPP